MKRLFYALLHHIRQRAAIRAYRHSVKRTTDLCAVYACTDKSLREAIKAEAAAEARMEQVLNQ